MKYLNQFVQRSDVLGRLRLTARQLAELTKAIRTAIPAELADHVVGCAPKPNAIVVLVDSAAWASQLRYVQQDMLAACQRIHGPAIRQVRIKILPPDPPAEKPPSVSLSSSSRMLLRRTAEGIQDEDLANALRRLGRKDDQDAD